MGLISCGEKRTSQDYLINEIEELQQSTRSISDTNKIKKILEKGLISANKIESDTLRLKYKRKIACEYYNNEMYKPYYNLTKENLKKALSLNDSLYSGIMYSDLGDYFQNKFQFDSAYYNYRKALPYYKIVNKYHILTNYEIARLLSKENLHVESEILIFQNLANALSFGDPEIIHNFYVVLGMNYYELKEYDLSLKAFDKAFDYIDKIEIELIKNIKSSYKSQYYQKVGTVFKKKQNYERARYFYEQSINNLKENQNKFIESFLLRDIEELNFLENKSVDIGKCLKALKISNEQNFEDNIVYTTHLLAKVYFKKEDSIKGLHYLNKAIILAEKNKFNNEIIEIYTTFSKVDLNNQNKWYKKIIDLKNELLHKERSSRNKFAKITFETQSVFNNYKKLNNRLKTSYVIFFLLIIISSQIFYIHIKKRNDKILNLDKLKKQANIEVYDLLIEQQDILEKGKKIEKNRISRELHDNIVSEIYGLRMSAEISVIKDKNLKEEIIFIADKLKQIEENARNLSHEIIQVSISNKKIISIIKELIKQYVQKNEYVVNFNYNENIEDSIFNNLLKINLYRIIQESLKNIDKYAKASQINIFLDLNNKTFTLEIEDNGIGFNVNKTTFGIGLKNIKERTLECNGIFHLESKVNNGTKIKCVFYNI